MTAEVKEQQTWSSRCVNLKLLSILLKNEPLYLVSGFMEYQDEGSTAAFSCSYPTTEQTSQKNYATIGYFRTQTLLINERNWVKYYGRRIPLR